MPMPFTPCDPATMVNGQCTDVSVDVMTRIFGNVIQQLAAGADPNTVQASTNVLASIMQYFNSGIFVIAGVILSYIVTMGVLQTANDGEALGKNWSSVFTPLRVVSGGMALLPSASGYSYIQIAVLSLGLWGAGFANGIFNIGVQNGIIGGTIGGIGAQMGLGSNAAPNPNYPLYDMRKFAADYLAISWCRRIVNTVYDQGVSDGTAKPNIDRILTSPDVVAVESNNKKSRLYLYKDRNSDSNLGGGAAICGSVKSYDYTAQSTVPLGLAGGTIFDASAINSNDQAISAVRQAALVIKYAAIESLMASIDDWVNTWPTDTLDGDFSQLSADKFNTITSTAQQALVGNFQTLMTSDTTFSTIMTKYTTDITKDGWMMAGGFYQRIGGIRDEMNGIFSETVFEASKPALTGLPSDALGSGAAAAYTTVYNGVISKALGGPNAPTPARGDLSSLTGLFGSGKDMLNIDTLGNRGSGAMNTFVGGAMQGTLDKLVGTDGHVDMLTRIKTVGDSFAVTQAALSTANYTITGILDGAVVGATGIGSFKFFGTGVDAGPAAKAVRRLFIDLIGRPMAEITTWLGRLAFWFGIFIPTLPYFIFMTAVVGWVLSLLQAIVTGPLWAVMHMTPERSFIGGQSQGYLLLLSLFARPALIITGLFAAMVVADPVLQYVSMFFFATRTANVTSSESLGWFIQFLTFKDWMIMYGLVITPIVYMIFGLSAMLPDTVLSWLGAGIKSLGETQATGEMRAGMEKHRPMGLGGGSPKGPNNGAPKPLPGGGEGGDDPSGGQRKDSAAYANHQGVEPILGLGHSGGTTSTNANAQGAGGGSGQAQGTAANVNGQGAAGGTKRSRKAAAGAESNVAAGGAVESTTNANGQGASGGTNQALGGGTTPAAVPSGSSATGGGGDTVNTTRQGIGGGESGSGPASPQAESPGGRDSASQPDSAIHVNSQGAGPPDREY